MAKTAALLPTSGDPHMAAYWCRNYERVWRDDVDEVQVLLNGNPAAASIYESVGAKVTITAPIGHGQALNMLIANTDADAIVTFEDDCFVRTPGAIRQRLERILAGETDIIGTPRGGMSPEVEAASKAKWGWPEGPDTSSGTGLWPAFLFARPADLRRVPFLRCEAWTWQQGETIPGLDWVCPSEMTTDVMTAVAFQLRAMGLRITPDVQYKEMWQKDFEVMRARTGEPPYFHAGGMANELPSVGRPGIGMESNEGRDWAHRIWWRRHVGIDDSADAARMQVDADYWNGKAEPWINWDDR